MPPGDLQVQQTLPGAYDPLGIGAGTVSGGSVALTWNGVDAFTSAQAIAAAPASYPGAVLLDPSAGLPYGGNGTTEWLLVAVDGQGQVDYQSFTLAGGTFTADGVVRGADHHSR